MLEKAEYDIKFADKYSDMNKYQYLLGFFPRTYGKNPQPVTTGSVTSKPAYKFYLLDRKTGKTYENLYSSVVYLKLFRKNIRVLEEARAKK